jgi:glycosyltransferase involved in cell wall biosynthesis
MAEASASALPICYAANLRVRGGVGGESHVRGVAMALQRHGRLHSVLAPRSKTLGDWKSSLPGKTRSLWTVPTPAGMVLFDFILAIWIVGSHWSSGRKVLLVRPHAFTLMQILIARVLGWPILIELNGVMEVEFKSIGRHHLLRYPHIAQMAISMRLATGILCVTPGIKDWVMERHGVSPDRAIVMPNAVDPESIEGCGERDDMRRRLGVGHDEVLLGFVGSFSPWQGVIQVVDAVARMDEQLKFKLVLMGEGDDHDEIHRHARAAPPGRIMFLPPVTPGEVHRYLCAMDYGLLLRDWPLDQPLGSPLKLYEYLAAGLRVIATRVDGIRDLDPGLEHINFVDHCDSEQLEQEFTSIIRDHDQDHLQKRDDIASIVRQYHTWDARVSLIDRALQK